MGVCLLSCLSSISPELRPFKTPCTPTLGRVSKWQYHSCAAGGMFNLGSLPVVLLTGGTFAASCRTLPGVLETGEANAVQLSVSSRVLDISTQVRQRHSQLTLTSKIQLAPCLSSRVFFLLLRGRRGQFQHSTFCMADAYTGTEGASSSTVAFEGVTQDEFGQ